MASPIQPQKEAWSTLLTNLTNIVHTVDGRLDTQTVLDSEFVVADLADAVVGLSAVGNAAGSVHELVADDTAFARGSTLG